ncbi:helix-turn-helix domain-containing protein [Rhodococcus opacus]|uniref:Putative Xre family DNA-binding protein n=1 Tax=Rhodococcus opacus (strain B4) TaxID=632772 RepID=C1BCL7_RHOOB|nr:helix-turn-helix transcriptional regulator [Rhodococcus opacus]BAH56072.1 putative Xre family DNA-binding protein [Rhodococcus opacus B4]
MSKSKIDVAALFAAIDGVRKQRGQSMRQLAKEIGVSPSLLSRLGNGYRPDADGFVTLTRWLGMPAEQFIADDDTAVTPDQPELVAQLAPLLRARKDLAAEDVEYLEDIIEATVRRTRAARIEQ